LEVRHREFRHRLAVTGKHGPERLDVLEIRLRLRQHRHPFEAVDHLRVHGLLDPRGAVLIERDDTRRRRHELRTRLAGGRPHEFEDGPLGRAVVPGGERIRLCTHTCVREDHNAERERYRAATSRTTRETDRKLHAPGLLYAPPHRVNDSSLTKATGKVCPSAAWKYVRDQRQAGPDGIVPVINAARDGVHPGSTRN